MYASGEIRHLIAERMIVRAMFAIGGSQRIVRGVPPGRAPARAETQHNLFFFEIMQTPLLVILMR